jgi:DNA-binding transcriptional regulator YbjK
MMVKKVMTKVATLKPKMPKKRIAIIHSTPELTMKGPIRAMTKRAE